MTGMTPAEQRRSDARNAAIDLTAPLTGGTIEGPYIEEGDWDGEFWPGFIVKMPDGTTTTVVISKDPEGNGPGHIFLENRP